MVGRSQRLEEPLEETSNRKLTIACQGGGSHTAFTVGILKGLLLSGRLQEH
jgi:predicted acylesterase/phospholipase RssA